MLLMLSGSTSKDRSFKSPVGEKLSKRLHLGAFFSLVTPKLFANLRPGRSSQGSLFEASRNVEIGGGQFNSAQGHHANFTINFNRVSLFSCASDPLTHF